MTYKRKKPLTPYQVITEATISREALSQMLDIHIDFIKGDKCAGDYGVVWPNGIRALVRGDPNDPEQWNEALLDAYGHKARTYAELEHHWRRTFAEYRRVSQPQPATGLVSSVPRKLL